MASESLSLTYPLLPAAGEGTGGAGCVLRAPVPCKGFGRAFWGARKAAGEGAGTGCHYPEAPERMTRLGEIGRMVQLADSLKLGDAVPLIPHAARIVRNRH